MFRSYYFQISWRIAMVVAWAVGLSYTIFTNQMFVWISFMAIGLLIQIILLIRFQYRVIDRINYFFESIKNEDFSQNLDPLYKSVFIQSLHQNMKSINDYIQKVKIEAHQQEQYFRALIEQVSTGILTFNQKGFVIHANQSLKKLLNLEQITHIKQLEKVDIKLAQAIRQIQPNEQKLIQCQGIGGNKTLLIKSGLFKNQKESLILISVQDINRELDEKELDSWMKLIRVLTHEIMNSIAPVTSISESLSHIFQKDGKPVAASEIDESLVKKAIYGLDIINEQGKGLISFVESYRKFSRIPKPEKKEFCAGELLEKIAILRRAVLPDDHTRIIVREYDPSLSLYADENLISQVLINLVRNAVEALDNKGNGEIEMLVKSNSTGQVEIQVHDNGPGIPPELIDEIFVPFFTTRKNGSGIGLSLSRQIMRLHGGSLKVQSVPGKETVFTLLFIC